MPSPLLYFVQGVAEARCILVTGVCVCLSVPRCIPTLLHCTDPDVTWGNSRGCPLVVHDWYELLWQQEHSAECEMPASACTHSMPGYILRRRRKMYWSSASVCLSVCECVSVRGRTHTLLHGPGCNLGTW